MLRQKSSVSLLFAPSPVLALRLTKRYKSLVQSKVCVCVCEVNRDVQPTDYTRDMERWGCGEDCPKFENTTDECNV